jgi:hypothetical protein
MMKALAYTREIISPEGEVISGNCQVEQIRRFAAENSTEVVAWFTDEEHENEILGRPGIGKLLAWEQPYDFVLGDKVWAFARSMAALEPFLQELDRRGVGFEIAKPAWDVLSQKCRRRSRSQPVLPRTVQLRNDAGEFRRYRVSRPAHLYFVNLVHHRNPSIFPGL